MSDPLPDSSQHQTKRGAVLAAMMLAMFMAAIEATIVATAMPTIVSVLGGFELFSWVFSIFLLCQAVTIPIYGKLADLFGRKPVFFFGTGLFLVASLLAGLSTSMIQLIIYRALQGLGAGAIMPIAATIIGDIYNPEERARIQGYLASVWGIASVIGPALGALFVQKLNWSLVFWINIPVGILSIAMTAIFLKEEVTRKKHTVDYLGSLQLMVGTALIMLVMIQSSQFSTSTIFLLSVVSAVLLIWFLFRQARVPEPMMPLDIWKDPVIAIGNTGGLIAGALLISVTTFLPSYVQGVMGGSPASAGFTLSMMSIGWPLASAYGGRLMVRTSYRFVAILGGIMLVVGALVLAMLTPERGPLWAGAGTFLVGVGMGFSMTTFLVAIQSSVNWNRRGVATSSNLFMRLVGMSFGAAIFGVILNYHLEKQSPGILKVINQIMDPITRSALDPQRLARLQDAMSGSLHQIYLYTVFLAIGILLLSVFIPRGLSPRNQPQKG
ncbi:MFS transporter [bacterium]|nr:MFS transporter [bacterium]